MKFAEDQPYWDTTVHHQKSSGEIYELLEDFGAERIMTLIGQASGKYAWLIRFQWEGRAYRFLFKPLDCQYPNKVSSFGGKRRVHTEQARYQMGRRAFYLVKAVLTAALDEPAVLFGFLELPGASQPGGLPATAAEVDMDKLTGQLPEMPTLLLGIGEDSCGSC